jgi:hypothetical protein
MVTTQNRVEFGFWPMKWEKHSHMTEIHNLTLL